MKREPLVLTFAVVFPTVMAWLYFVVASPAKPVGHEPNPWMQALYVVGKFVQFGMPVIWLFLVDRAALRDFPLRRVDSAEPNDAREYGVRFGFWFGIAVSALAAVIYLSDRPREQWLLPDNLFFGAPELIRGKLREFNAFTPLRYAALAAFLAIVNSFFEEYYWRWFVFGRLRKYVPVFVAVLISSFAFMGHHVIVLSVYFPTKFGSIVVPFSLAIAFGGAVWAWNYHQSGSLVGPWLSHFIVDVAVMVIGYDLAFHQ